MVIDVREPHEYEICNIGAKLIPMGEVLEHLNEIPKEGKVVVHCRSGARSRTVVNTLMTKFAYTNLYNLQGGILQWADSIDPTLAKY